MNPETFKLFLLALIFALSGCGGGGGGSSQAIDPGDNNDLPADDAPVAQTAETGVFLDGPVANIGYRTQSQSGFTNENGEYNYLAGETVTFFIGDLVFPEVEATGVVTPLDLADTSDVSDNMVVNITRLFLTLDTDANADNGIDISDVAHEVAVPLNFNLSSEGFANSSDVLQMISNAGQDEAVLELISEEESMIHFQQTLDAVGVEYEINYDSDTDGDGVLDIEDAFPDDPDETLDLDKDGVGNNQDDDDDGDGIVDSVDLFPFDADEYLDFDSDGIGDNRDLDDDNDLIPDTEDSRTELISDLQESISELSDIVYDVKRGLAYITQKQGKSLTVMSYEPSDASQASSNIEFAAITNTFNFDFMPERMVMSPDGSRLYVALLVQEHSYNWQEEDQNGYIAVFDLDLQAQVDTLAINIDPYDLVVTSSDKLVVSSGSGQWSNILAYDAATGNELGRARIRHRSHLSLHPDEDWVFAADTDISPSDIEKFDISGVGITALGDSPYHGDHRMNGNVWATPDGTYVITRGGDLFLTSDMTYVRSIGPSGVFIENIEVDMEHRLIFLLLSDNTVLIISSESYEIVDSLDFAGQPESISVADDYLFYWTLIGESPLLIKRYHPCLECSDNTEPVADFVYTPFSGDITDTYTFDASYSSDAEDVSLSYRWDINADGSWDTDFLSSSSYEHDFILAGTKYVRLQVKDSGGLVDTLVKSFDVAQGVDPGTPGDGGEAYELPFTVTDVVTDVARGKAYITDKSGQRLYVVDLATGFVDKYFDMLLMPERMTMSPDGSRLYVALLAQEHSSYWGAEDQTGYIAVFDLDLQAQVDTLAINIDPYDLVVTSGGKLVVTSGSGQWTNILAYDAATGNELGRSGTIRERSYLSLHPDEDSVFVSSYSFLDKFDISGTGIEHIGDSIYGYSISGNNWAMPDGTYVITRGGDLFLASDMTYVRSLTESGLLIEDLAFDEAKGLIFVAHSDGSLAYYNASSFEYVGAVDGVSNAAYALVFGDHVFGIELGDLSNALTAYDHPCLECSDNTEPVADFVYTPLSGDTTDTYTFDASYSSDAEDVSLSYRWDINADGSWDTDFLSSSSYEHDFILAGTKYVRLQVKDSGGLVDTLVKSFDVAQGVDPGTPGDGGEAYELPFTVTDVVTDVARGKAYITDKSGQRLYVVDLATGFVDKYFDMLLMPERMTMSPDGSRLYVALLVQEHSSYWWEEDQSGYIAVFDLDLQAQVDTLAINIDPYDLVVTSGGKLVVTSGSGQWTNILAYDAATGNELGRANIRQRSYLSLHPDEDWVFAADTDISPSDIEKFDISGVGITGLGDSPYHGDHRMNGNVWATPDGTYVITRGGDLFLASDMTYVRSLTESGLLIEDLAFDEAKGLIFVAHSDGSLAYYNASSFEYVGAVDGVSNAAYVLLAGLELFIIKPQPDFGAELEVLSHPSDD